MLRPHPYANLSAGTPPSAGLRRHVTAALALAGESEAVKALRCALASLAGLDGPILIVGEPGVGRHACAETLLRDGQLGSEPLHVLAPDAKELEDPIAAFARMRSERPAVADGRRPAVYLEDVERMPLRLQAALADALARGEHVRVIAGAPPHLAELVQLGRFDRDLDAILSRVAVHVPPLRDRLSDIGAIAAADDSGRPLPASTVAALAEHAWPGNILELVEVLTRGRLLSAGSHLTASAVRHVLGNRPRRWRGFDVLPLRELERRYLLAILARFGGNRSRAAHHLGISRNTLARKLQGEADARAAAPTGMLRASH